jgi:APA family basic amino acid/polyamine antiporter
MENLKGQKEIGVIASINLFGHWIKPIVISFILVMFLGSISAIIFGASRVYYAMAKDRLFFPSLGEVHPKYGTPYKALLAQCGYAIFLLFFNSLQSLLYMITVAVMMLSILTAITPFFLKRKGFVSNYKIPFYPFTPIFFSLGNTIVIIYLSYMYPENAINGIALTLFGIPVYYIFRRKFKS